MRAGKMNDDLAAFLAPLTAFAEEIHTWPADTMRLACYLTDRTPPPRYVTSARVVVTDGDRVLVVQDPTTKHIMPGGRLEPNSYLEAPQVREASLFCSRPRLCSNKRMGGVNRECEGVYSLNVR